MLCKDNRLHPSTSRSVSAATERLCHAAAYCRLSEPGQLASPRLLQPRSGLADDFTDGPSGTVVEAGRYVSNPVFVAARQSSPGFSQVEVDVDLSKHLKLQIRPGNGSATKQGSTPENDPGSSVGAVYQFEY